jgi:predicted phage baseplate assembly protein
MSQSLDPTLRGLNDCECCDGRTVPTPVKVENRPGLNAVVYRVGVHPQFLEAMLARLSASRYPALQELTTRDKDDFSVALLDAWATVGDVLTFYQERIANESYLRTATERRSVLALARLIGYQPSPGVAASTYLAFTLEDAAGSPDTTTIVEGTQVQSIPGPDEQPQTFETVEKIEARAAWNAIRPRLIQPQPLSLYMNSITVQGTTTNLKKGDRLLIVLGTGESNKIVRRITNVLTKPEKDTTIIELEKVLIAIDTPIVKSLQRGIVFRRRVRLSDQTIKAQIINKKWNQTDLSALVIQQGWSMKALSKSIARWRLEAFAKFEPAVFAFRKQAAPFGYNAPMRMTCNCEADPPEPNEPAGWDEWEPRNEFKNKIFLDNAYEEVVPGSYIAVYKPNRSGKIYSVKQVRCHPRTEYGISGKTTAIYLGADWWDPATDGFDVIRSTTVDVQSEKLDISQIPISEPVGGNSVTLDDFYPYLQVGQTVIFTGEPIDQEGVVKSESMTVAELTLEEGFSVITFTRALTRSYKRETVTINANVARATHGETVQEVLGSGDASQPYQRFILRQPPLTHVSASTPRGTASTLQVRVNDLAWHETATLYGRGPKERVFITRTDDDGKTTTQFGDGATGARLPSGQNNVRAAYRKGIGLDGLVKAKQLSLLMTRPLGLKSVTNPLAANGAADPEPLNKARQNASLSVLTLGRTVSLKDYEDFARSFAGIAKALATWSWDGQTRRVFITVAGPAGAEILTESTLYQNLLAALSQAGDPFAKFQVESYHKALFRIAAKVEVDQDYLPEKVLTAAEQSLRARFSFDSRAFGQPVTWSEVIAAIQAVAGVKAVDLDRIYRVDGTGSARQPLLRRPAIVVRKFTVLHRPLLAAMPVSNAEGEMMPAELLTLDPGPLDLGII